MGTGARRLHGLFPCPYKVRYWIILQMEGYCPVTPGSKTLTYCYLHSLFVNKSTQNKLNKWTKPHFGSRVPKTAYTRYVWEMYPFFKRGESKAEICSYDCAYPRATWLPLPTPFHFSMDIYRDSVTLKCGLVQNGGLELILNSGLFPLHCNFCFSVYVF